MSDVEVGKLISVDEQRDAIHVAVAPVVASKVLWPGTHIGFVVEGDTQRVGVVATPIGIVDPFLKHRVSSEERFWMFLYPRTITSLRHGWTHPAFLPEIESAGSDPISKAWLRQYADRYDVSYAEMIEATRNYLKTGQYFSRGPTFEGENVPDEFWTHYERATGATVPDEDRRTFFSCSC